MRFLYPISPTSNPITKSTLETAIEKIRNNIICVILWGIAIGILAGYYLYFQLWHPNSASLADFKVFYQAAMDIRLGRDPFQPSLIALRVADQNPFLSTGNYYSYVLPFAIVFIPLTFLPLQVAALLWAILSIGCFVFTIRLLVQIYNKQHWQSLTPFLVICCSMIGLVHNELKQGQVDLILSGLIVSSFFAYTRERRALSGIPLALAVIIKPYLGLILLYFIWKRAYRVVIGFLSTVCVVFGLAVLMVGWNENIEWLQVAHMVTSVPHMSQPYDISLYSLLLRLFAPTVWSRPWIELGTQPAIIGALVLGCIVAVIVLLTVRRTVASPMIEALDFALWIAGMLLAFPTLEDIHTTPAIICLIIVMLSLSWRGITFKRFMACNIYPLLVFLYFLNPLLPQWQWNADITPVVGWDILKTSAYLFGLIFLFICTYRAVVVCRTTCAEPSINI